MPQIPAQLNDYDYIWFPVDNLAYSPNAIEQFFTLCREYKLDLSQPLLTLDSYIGVSILVANHSFILS